MNIGDLVRNVFDDDFGEVVNDNEYGEVIAVSGDMITVRYVSGNICKVNSSYLRITLRHQ